MKKFGAILVGAGAGKRLGQPKSFILIDGLPLFYLPFRTLERHSLISEIILVVPKNKVKYVRSWVSSSKKRIKVISGGRTRFQSVKNGVKFASSEILLIHDVARPLISFSLVDELLRKSKKKSFVVPYIPPYDTAIYNGKRINRDKLLLIQTPQLISRKLLLKAYRNAGKRVFPDESTLVQEILDEDPLYIKGEPFNFKITTPQNLSVFLTLTRGMRIPFIGFGYDFHRLVKNRPLFIGGIKIPSKKGALGHSDGDVLLHSIVDSILGALSLGDIGMFFKDTDPRWKNTRSGVFVKKTLELVKESNSWIHHIDSVVLLEKPRLTPYKKKICKNIARLLEIKEQNISLKAKTFEGVGIIGEGNGVVAYSICLLFQNTLAPDVSTLKSRS